jgi:hypothetical protein
MAGADKWLLAVGIGIDIRRPSPASLFLRPPFSHFPFSFAKLCVDILNPKVPAMPLPSAADVCWPAVASNKKSKCRAIIHNTNCIFTHQLFQQSSQFFAFISASFCAFIVFSFSRPLLSITSSHNYIMAAFGFLAPLLLIHLCFHWPASASSLPSDQIHSSSADDASSSFRYTMMETDGGEGEEEQKPLRKSHPIELTIDSGSIRGEYLVRKRSVNAPSYCPVSN